MKSEIEINLEYLRDLENNNLSSTWKNNRNDAFSRTDLTSFYKNSSGKGLIEKPTKIFPYKLYKDIHGSRTFKFSLKGILSFVYISITHSINFILPYFYIIACLFARV